MEVTCTIPRKRHGHVSTFRLVRESIDRTPYDTRIALRQPRDVFAFMAPVIEREETESFYLLPLDAQHRLQHAGALVITRGIINSTLVAPREVFRAAIVANAFAVILVHNHPSGDPTPSADDRIVTEQLVAAGRLLDIRVQDHVIIGAGRYTSFAEAGLL